MGTFAVPGSVFLNVLAGAIFGTHFGFILCSLLTACGASLCYFLARLVGEGAVARWFPNHLFFLSVLVGLMPYNYLCVTSGAILSEIKDLGDVVSWANMARCATAALAALLPTLLLRGRKPSANQLQSRVNTNSSTVIEGNKFSDDANSNSFKEDDSIRAPGVIDGKS